ncbi:hypothetical protein [Streptomyces sp. NPDC059166]|uniref:hypothetical protein n=1 Tax=Streptomyces sp. NPDC059166 TaxID=3346752 RepID=UPI0036A00B9E
MKEIRTVEIEGHNWLVLADVLASVDRAEAGRNPMFVARIPSDERQMVKVDGRWTWLVTEFGADWAAGQDWRKHGDPAAYGRDRASERAHEQFGPELHNDRPEPAHLRLAAEYRSKIQTGRLPVGEKLPNVDRAIRLHSVARDAVGRAYRLLRDEGLIVYRPGKGGGYWVKGADRD